jgi:hypothetical protein
MSNTRQPAKTLPCLFKDIVDKYPKSQLRPCKTDSQTWKHASAPAAVERVNKLAKYFPELSLLNNCLGNYSLCINHYNQVVATDNFYQNLLNSDLSSDIYLIQKNKRFRQDILETGSSNSAGKNCDGDKVIDDESNILGELQKTKDLLEICQLDCQQKSQCIIDLNNKISQQQHLLEAQKLEIEGLKQKLIDSYNQLIKVQDENNTLSKQWDSRFSSQQKRIDAAREIAFAERESMYDDIEIFIRNNNRFSLDNLINYSPQIWLSKRNQVLVKFIETLTYNNNSPDDLSQEKIFKRAVAVDTIYGTRHGKYVSEVNLIASAIKYSLARSKKVINIDNHITSGGGYSYFQKWLEDLSDEEEPLPDGFLFIAFDNEQRGQKNYLDRGFNTVIYHVVTSFVAFNMESSYQVQHINNPWVYDNLNKQQYKELFELSPGMQEEIDKELFIYLSEILGQLNEEKLSSTNVINTLMTNRVSKNGFDKYCSNCNEYNIENKKQCCPKCKSKLPTLGELRKLNIAEEINSPDDFKKPPVFKSHNIESESNVQSISRISITQQLAADPGVKVPDIYIPDPLNINPNSIANVEKILFHIEKIAGIKEGQRKWVVVVCDGIPYHHATKIKNKFPWLIILPGPLHEEMNMLRAYVELNW